MEEEIKILEETINSIDFNNKEQVFVLGINQIELIQNLIKGYKELELCLKAEEKYAEGLNNDIKSLLNIEPNDNFIPKSKIREKIEEIDEILALEPVGNKLEELLTKRKTYIELLQEGDK